MPLRAVHAPQPLAEARESVISMKALIRFFALALRPNPKCDAARPDSLAALPDGTEARILAIDLPAALRGRLLELGFLPGAPIRAVRRAPLGDPMQVFIRGSHVSLRGREAAAIRVVRSGE